MNQEQTSCKTGVKSFKALRTLQFPAGFPKSSSKAAWTSSTSSKMRRVNLEMETFRALPTTWWTASTSVSLIIKRLCSLLRHWRTTRTTSQRFQRQQFLLPLVSRNYHLRLTAMDHVRMGLAQSVTARQKNNNQLTLTSFVDKVSGTKNAASALLRMRVPNRHHTREKKTEAISLDYSELRTHSGADAPPTTLCLKHHAERTRTCFVRNLSTRLKETTHSRIGRVASRSVRMFATAAELNYKNLPSLKLWSLIRYNSKHVWTSC